MNLPDDFFDHDDYTMTIEERVEKLEEFVLRIMQSLTLVFILISILCIVIFFSACGEAHGENACRMSTSVLAGDWTLEESIALTETLDAFRAVGLRDPGYYVTFIHSPEHPIRGTTWKRFRLPGTPARYEEEGYKGYCDRENCIVYIRRYGMAREYLYGLLRHELVHALGYSHGEEMQEVEKNVKDYLKRKEENDVVLGEGEGDH